MHTGELKHCNKLLCSYSNHKLKPVAAVDLSVHYKQCAMEAEFEIVDIAQESILSGATAEAFGLTARLNSLQNTTEAGSQPDTLWRAFSSKTLFPKAYVTFPS